MFRVCPHCDFEWHEEDGDSCPACHHIVADESESARRSERYDGGALELIEFFPDEESLQGAWVNRTCLSSLPPDWRRLSWSDLIQVIVFRSGVGNGTGEERFFESLLEIVSSFEIRKGVVFRSSEDSMVN